MEKEGIGANQWENDKEYKNNDHLSIGLPAYSYTLKIEVSGLPETVITPDYAASAVP
jgi:hypothetical protein